MSNINLEINMSFDSWRRIKKKIMGNKICKSPSLIRCYVKYVS